MSRAPVAVPAPVSRPTGLDYLLILAGCSLSFFLHEVSHPDPRPKADTPAWVEENLFPTLPRMLTLPQGIILLWPLFYATQKLRGRPAALSAGEWLLGLAWLGTVLVTGWNLWMHWGTPPGFAADLAYPPESVWTVIVLPVMAGVAVLIALVSLFRRRQAPWTHAFGLVLVIWPVLPLIALLAWAEPGWRWTG